MGGAAETPPAVLLLCRRDRDEILEVLEEQGGCVHSATAESVPRIFEESDIDLAVADGDPDEVEALLRALELWKRDGKDPRPLILLTDPEGLESLAARLGEWPQAILLARPLARTELATAIRSSLTLRAQQQACADLVDELTVANAELEQRRREARAEAQRRTELLAAISHNLRTPVNGLVLFSQVVEPLNGSGQARLPAGWDQLKTGLIETVGTLRELVDDLLDIAHFGLGTVSYHESTFPIGAFLKQILEPCEALARRKGLGFQVVADPKALARTDPDHLSKLVRNLASNAVKFTAKGSVTVDAKTVSGRGLVLEVRDTGEGIAPENQQRIFDEFAALRNPERDPIKGTGLGLAICRRLAEVMGGWIELESAPGLGSTFRVTLPGAAPAIPARASDPNG